MKIMAVDLGKVRTGIAICDESEMLASPVTVIHEHNEERLLEKISQIISKRYTPNCWLWVCHEIWMAVKEGKVHSVAAVLQKNCKIRRSCL